jgi:hypothetical protein
VSMIGDYWKDRLPQTHPWVVQPREDPYAPLIPSYPPSGGSGGIGTIGISREEFEALKKEMQELKELLKAAKKFDEATNQPHCEQDDKVALIKKIAELVGVDMKDVLD